MGFWGWVFMATIGWGIWSALPPDSCVRVHRAAAPVRGAGTLVRMAVKNWTDPQTNIDLEKQVNALSAATEEFIAQEFYGNSLKCRWGNSESEIGFGVQNAIPDSQAIENEAKNAASEAQNIVKGMNPNGR